MERRHGVVGVPDDDVTSPTETAVDADGAGGTSGVTLPDEQTARWRETVADLLAVDRAVVDDVTAGTGLLAVQADLLIRLSRLADHRSPMNVLAAAMRVSGSSLTKLVDRLSELGYARRDASENDRRVVYVVLTPEGVEKSARLRDRYARVLRTRVLASVDGGAAGLADIARRLA